MGHDRVRGCAGSPRLRCRVVPLVVFWAAAVGWPLAAQNAGRIEGRIAGSDGRAVAGAWIEVIGANRAAYSDADGRYRIDQVPVGSREVTIRAIGWKRIRLAVSVPPAGPAKLDVVLEAEPVLLADVIVSVSREAQSRARATASVGVIDRSELSGARPHHPADVVRRVPGAWVVSLSGEGHMTAIRQPITTKPVYAFLEDGVPIRSTGFFNHNALYEINLPAADRVEIIKGPGSALFGSDAIGGVVSAFTRPPSAHGSGELFVEGGRFGYARALGTASDTWGRNGLRVDLNVTRSDSYRDRAPYSRQSGTVRWDHRVDSATALRTVLAISHIDQPGDGGSEVSEPDFESRPQVNYSPIAFRRVLSLRGSSSLERRGPLSLLSGTIYGRFNELDLLPFWQLSFDPQIWESRHGSAGFMGRYRRTVPSLRANLSAGLDLEASPGSRLERRILPEQRGSIFETYVPAEVQYDYRVTFWQASPYAELEVTPIDRLRIDAGVRFDYVGYDYRNRLTSLASGTHRRPGSTDVSYRRINPKLGATLEAADNVHLFASYRSAFRAPSESQLFRQGSAVTTVDLEPVAADNLEVGARMTLGRWATAEATLFQLDVENDILTFFDPATGLRTATNAGATRHRGIELGLSVRPAPPVRIDGSWTVSRHQYREWRPNPTIDYGGRGIELAPDDMGRLGVVWSPRALGSGHFAGEWIHQGGYWMDPANTARYHGHDVLGLSAVVPLSQQLELVGRIENLTDRRYAEMSSYTVLQGRRYRPGPPRTVYLGAQYRFGGQDREREDHP